MKMQLRDYQNSIVCGVEEIFSKGDKRLCIVAPCGAGKTVIAAYLTQQALDDDKRVLFFVHRKELIEQTAATFARFNIPFGVISGDSPCNYNLPVQIASVQTLVNRLDAFVPNLIICDEAHHVLAASYLKIIGHWKDAKLIGLTATPERTGGIRLGDVFQKLVLGPTVRQLIQQHQLAPFIYFSPDDLDFSDIKVVAGDFAANQAADFMSDKKIVGSIVANYRDKANSKQAICYCVNIEHSKLMAGKFNDAGIPAAQCDADTPKSQREDIIAQFRRGSLKILCNVNLFGEGFDVPGVDAVILDRFVDIKKTIW